MGEFPDYCFIRRTERHCSEYNHGYHAVVHKKNPDSFVSGFFYKS